MNTPKATDLGGRALDFVMGVVEAPINGFERLMGRKRMPYLFLAPNLILFGIFTFLPIAIAVGYAFTGGTGLFVSERPFVGFDNFRQLLQCEDYLRPGSCRESLFWTAVWNTLWFVGFNVAATLLVALVTALILNRAIAARGFFRAMFFYPVLLSPVVIGLIWKWFLDRNGLLNAFLQMLGVPPEIFLLDVGWSRFFVVVVSVWFHMGFYTLILLAGLQAIPKDLYEAASIDAASPRRTLFRITLPLLGPNLLVVLILLMIRSVQIFDEAWVLTNGGGPGTANSFIVQYIYQMAFGSDLRLFGLASAASVLMGLVLLALTLIQLRLGRKMES
ncbi:carbohydrate ABC transporter permease [Neorhizobium galegae]|uniref:carbohydrate ABC transporter permease n=1 Tax=Neorhizobium galegae TaxID=399 RepID=UPI00062269B0|nr:sugar ABC transporter permease [Neorhizobium galegae]KAB1121994.1 sugar ABC transporter permease [Neorhizobium galegae]MCQ1809441.1 sugar ABC transporter permease [Neorhizobium galegae]CDZ64022.1 ABC-type sugar transport systems, permease component [Neorhizobium galegae bv. orientalis]